MIIMGVATRRKSLLDFTLVGIAHEKLLDISDVSLVS
ncbi:hypothetical protein DEV91_106130 [Phyllobacterium brassicacearum]|nr:hypothetical protein DEV91_106130 [Phyllobacterium brassicacearum]